MAKEPETFTGVTCRHGYLLGHCSKCALVPSDGGQGLVFYSDKGNAYKVVENDSDSN